MNRVPVPFEFKFADNAPDGTFEGYGSMFGNVDQYGDIVVKGAFNDTLKEWKDRNSLPKMLLQHGGFVADDLMPIGVWQSMKEDNAGLYCKGQLFALNTQRGQYIYEGMKAGALDGLSIGYMPKEFELGTKPGDARRLLKKVDLMEVSVVTFPANQECLVTEVKELCNLSSLSDCEKFAREAFNLSRKQAVAFVSAVKRVALRDAVADKETSLLAALRQANEAFR